MHSLVGFRRVVVVVLEGLRQDAINDYRLPTLKRLAAGGASTTAATTVSPPVMAAAMSALLTEVAPLMHGTRFTGHHSPSILSAARHALAAQRRGLLLLNWPDADRAGHVYGWQSPEYMAAARQLDTSLGLLTALIEIPRDPGTLLIALSDHGGSPEGRAFIMLAGGSVRRGELAGSISILDVPPTVLWALGIVAPVNYPGTPLCAAFSRQKVTETIPADLSRRVTSVHSAALHP